MTSLHEVALLRLVAQRIAGPRAATAAEAVRGLTAAQGQDYQGALTSVCLRTAGGIRSDVEAALDAGEVVRSWPMRGTLHLVAAEDLGWLRDLCAPRVLAGFSQRRERLGITEADAQRAHDTAVAALRGGGRLARAVMLRALAEGGVPTDGQRGYHLLAYLAHTGTVCLGPTGDGEQLFVLTEEWIPAPRRLEGEAALRELALRFFASHGPATVADLARWSGLRLTGCRAEARGVFLLPGFDEFVLGYADRTAVLEPAFAERIVPGGNGMFRATVVSDGRIVGTWRRAGRGADRTVEAEPFTAFDDDVTAMIPELAAALPA